MSRARGIPGVEREVSLTVRSGVFPLLLFSLKPVVSLWPLRVEDDATNSYTLRGRNEQDNPNGIRQRIGRESGTVACFAQSQRQAGAWDTLEWKREGFRCSLTGGCWQRGAGGC